MLSTEFRNGTSQPPRAIVDRGEAHAGTFSALQSMKILVVDDEPINIALLEGMLGDEGFANVLSTTDSRLALSLYQEFQPDLILLDLMMPHLDGFGVLGQISEACGTETFLPVMVLTADATEATKQRALAAGATDFLVKPFNHTEALLRITNLLESRRVHLALAAHNEQLEDSVRERTAELERALATLRATQQQVVQSERLKALGEMVTGIAHDFNNALSLILGYGEFLQRECRKERISSEMADATQTIVTAALDAAEIVQRLRDFHRPLDAADTLRPVALDSLIDQTVAFTRPRWGAQSLARGVTVEVVTELGRTHPIPGNPAELREMLTNLIFNAVDAMPQGGRITLRTQAIGDRIELAVNDTGVGMNEEVRRRCLEPFFTTKGERGSGLGLAMVYGTVERHRGTVAIESEPGRGTTFRFQFPLDYSGSAAPAVEVQTSTCPQRILVVDDQPELCDILRECLLRDWHTVETAGNGQEALDKMDEHDFDLIITDHAMANMNGEQLAAAVKARTSETRVILLTGFNASTDAEAKSEAVDLVLAKPATMAELRLAIHKVMQQSTDAE